MNQNNNNNLIHSVLNISSVVYCRVVQERRRTENKGKNLFKKNLKFFFEVYGDTDVDLWVPCLSHVVTMELSIKQLFAFHQNSG